MAALAGRPLPDLRPITDFGADFRREAGESVTSLLEHYAETEAEIEKIVGGLDDLGALCALESARQWSARWVLLHLMAETARHAGHADVVRQSIDGRHAGELMQAAEGRPDE
ncbi:hypothetical protein ABIA33_004547 [Streptacidiphilus sp. MAP12-16]